MLAARYFSIALSPGDRIFILWEMGAALLPTEVCLWLKLMDGWLVYQTSRKTMQKGESETAVLSDAAFGGCWEWRAAGALTAAEEHFSCVETISVVQQYQSRCCSAAKLLTNLHSAGVSCLIWDRPEWIQIHPNWLAKLMKFPCNWLDSGKLAHVTHCVSTEHPGRGDVLFRSVVLRGQVLKWSEPVLPNAEAITWGQSFCNWLGALPCECLCAGTESLLGLQM